MQIYGFWGDLTNISADEEALLFTGQGVSSQCVDADASHAQPSHQAWEPRVLGHDKRMLLRDVVLPAIASNTQMGRLAIDYSDRLKKAMAYQNAGI